MLYSQRTSTANNQLLIGLSLLLVLALTRSGHFGSAIKLPDTSWAMFWLAGALTVSRWWPVLLMLLAGSIDYIVIADGVNGYCVTPAYPFLIPTYLALWSAGRYASAPLVLDRHSILRMTLALLAGVSSAFIISNASFYYFSGYFSALSLTAYTLSVVRYWPHYLLTSALYVSCGLLLFFVIVTARKIKFDFAAWTIDSVQRPKERVTQLLSGNPMAKVSQQAARNKFEQPSQQ